MSDRPLPLIPYPRSVVATGGTCLLDSQSTVVIEPDARDLAAWAAPLLDLLRRGTGLPLVVQAGAASPGPAALTLGRLAGHPAEAYTLDIATSGAVLRAGDREGVIWGLQTLRQLLPAALERPLPAVTPDPGRPDGRLRQWPPGYRPPPGKPLPWPQPGLGGPVDAAVRAHAAVEPRPAWPLPCVRIVDRPRFAWRGLLLDSCRHFQDLAAIERLLDLMSLHRLNRLHWHLTEDQGWRLQIESRPRLTEIGAWRTEADGSRYGGFYTQDQARRIVAYAAARGIMVVPEIELPGHCQAALASYPELSCRGEPLAVAAEWGVFADIYCAGDDAVFSFLADVFTEVLDIFPSAFIHVGGDECPSDRWLACPRCRARMAAEKLRGADALHGWFVQRMARWLADRGRRLIGWDEILAGGLAPGSVVQSWRGLAGAAQAVRSGHDTIVSPISHVYLDQDIARVDLARVLAFDPEDLGAAVAEAAGAAGGRVLGGEMCLWTEWIPQAVIDERMFPRVCAGSEVLWSAADRSGRDPAEFRRRLLAHERRLRRLGVRVGPASGDGSPR